jgi:membrane protease subunit HflC
VANELRSTGGAEGEKIRADADRQREVIVAEAYREAQKVKGEGDAKASAIYAEAFGRDPQFAQFYRSLEAYRAGLPHQVRRDGARPGQRLLQGHARASAAPAAPAATKK